MAVKSKKVAKPLEWRPAAHEYVIARVDTTDVLLCVEQVTGGRLFAAIALEAPAGTPPAQFISHASHQIFLGNKFRTPRRAKEACERYLRGVRRQRARIARGAIEVIEPTDAERVFIRTWASTEEAAQA